MLRLRQPGDTNAGLLVLLTVLVLTALYFAVRPLYYDTYVVEQPAPAQDINVDVMPAPQPKPDVDIELFDPPDIIIETEDDDDRGRR